MYSKQYKTRKTAANSSETTVSNPLAPPRFFVQTPPQTPNLQAEQETATQSNSILANISILPPGGTRSPLPIQLQLTIGQPGDKYEKEADRVALEVVQRINADQSIQPLGQLKDKNNLQMKPLSYDIQRVEVSQDEEEMQMQPLVQRFSEQSGMAATPDLAASIQQARGSGQPLTENIRQPMEQAFGADFRGVKVHTDSQSDQLNQSIQAKAFTTGQDVFFRQGAYNPGSRGGQELIAHELTHVVQQNGDAVQRSQATRGYESRIADFSIFQPQGQASIPAPPLQPQLAIKSQPKTAQITHKTQQTATVQRKVGKIKKSIMQKSSTVHWYDWTQKGFVKSNRTVDKGSELEQARPTIYDDFAWVVTADGESGYLQKKNLKVKSWGAEKNPNYEDNTYLDQSSLLAPIGGQKSPKAYKETNREWYLDQAVLMEAYRSLEGKDPETQQQLALAMLQSFAKTAAPDPNSPYAPKGIQNTPFVNEETTYHRSATSNKLLEKLRELVAGDIEISKDTLQVLNDPSFMEVIAREFPVFSADETPEFKVNTDIDSITTFMDSLDDLITNVMGGHKPANTFVFNVTKFYEDQNCQPKDIQQKVTRPLEQTLIHRVSAQLQSMPEMKQDMIESVLDYIQLVILTKVKGVNILVVPKLFQPLSDEEKELFQDDELYREVNKERTRDHDGQTQTYKPRDIFMQSGSHDDKKLSSAMIESGARLDPIATKEAMLNFDSPEKLLGSSGIKVAELATKGAKTPTVCQDIHAFLSTNIFKKFQQLSKQKDAPPYQKIYPLATADLLAGLAKVNQDQGGLDQVFADKQIPDVLQIAYYRMMNGMAGAINDQGDLIKFMNNIELIHDQLQMILAIAQPHKSGSTFAQAITDYMRDTPDGESPTIPDGLDATVHHKASAMHSVASVLSSVENQKDQEKGTRSLNALVLKDNYYEASGAVASSKTYDVSVLDGYKLGKNELGDDAYENGKKPKGLLDIYICDFHHNISVERSEYKVEEVIHQVDELFDHGLVADKFTVAIDCTVDFIRSDDIRKFLAHNKNRITGGDLNVVLYRSAQKFDMLGMDNYYGGFTITINNGTSYAAFNERINQAEDQESGLSHQGMSHLAQFGAKHLDEYRALIMANTKKLYDGLPPGCKNQTSPLYIAHTEDPRNVFLDIQFPGRSEDFAVDGANSFYGHFINWASAQGLAFTTRPSFGFATTNFTTIAGSKVRLNPGLENDQAINKYIGYFTKIQQLLADTDKTNSEQIKKFDDENEKQKYLDKTGKATLQSWSVENSKPQLALENSSQTKITAPLGVAATTVNTIKGVKKPSQTSALEELAQPAPLIYDNPGANPALYYQVNNAGGFNLKVTSGNPGTGWTQVEQFCSYLATYWLNNGHGASGLKFADLDIATRQDAVNTLISWGSVGGLNAQQQYARQQTNGQNFAKNIVIQAVTAGNYPQGTRIWFGTDYHAEAAVVLSNGNYRVYDPNTGNTQEKTNIQFTQYIQNKNVFVVA